MAQTAPTTPAKPPAAGRSRERRLELGRDLPDRAYGAVVAGCVAAVGAFLALRLTAWPPHEDETLALYIGRGSLGDLADTVLGERGGAPLHYVFAWLVAHVGGGLGGLRLVSAAFALASIPLAAELVRRLTDRLTAALATALLSTSWVLLFHAVYARMYSIFLFTSLLSYLALLAALRDGGLRRWALWAAAILLCVATHPYGALVLASQGLFVLLARERLREAVPAGLAVVALGTPFWITDLVLAGRFGVGVGGGGARLGGPFAVASYLGDVAADFSSGPVVLPVVLALAAGGGVVLWRQRRRSALIALAAFGTPTLAFLAARLGSSAAPETRHLIFTLPFFTMLVATALVAVARSGREGADRAAALTAALLLVGGVAWAWQKTPLLFEGEPAAAREARDAAADWLLAGGRPDDVLMGYEPVFLEAWERDASFSRLVLPRADSRLAAKTLEQAARPLGRAVWVFDAADTTNYEQALAIVRRLPRPAAAFEARAFGPYLVIRTREPVRTPERYVELAASTMVTGKTLTIGDADINFATVNRIAERLGYEASSSRSRSTSSR
ncbi:MAG TPA: glycosyltransferase family 39 protein [Gaiellaceae bacterium]|nr:glycosyltransferase family 39 protein [Gaiellaceae bacterium]